MKETVKIFKIGGKVIDSEQELSSFLQDFAAVSGHKVLVHGGGKIATQMAERMGVATHMIGGRRVTTQEMLDVVLMVYGGLVNKKIVAKLQALGCDAVGLTGADMNCMVASKRSAHPIDYGFAGDIQYINSNVFSRLLHQNITPILAPLTHDQGGQLLNTNADTIAATTAVALAAAFSVALYFCFEKTGVLTDVQDDTSLVELLSFKTYQELKEKGVIADGMIPKLDNAFHTMQQGVAQVCIMQYSQVKHIEKQQLKATTLCL